MRRSVQIKRVIFGVATLIFGGANAASFEARYTQPTDAYAHGAVSGGEYTALELRWGDKIYQYEPQNAVFEDTAPRLVDLNHDTIPEIVTVVSGFRTGAQIVVFGLVNERLVPVLTTDPIGQRHRWLAIAGVDDLDGDGAVEIAYIDRPHLAKVLNVIRLAHDNGVWSWQKVADLPGLTNHHLRAPRIEGGLRQCSGHPVDIITADADWQQIMATRLEGGVLKTRPIGRYQGEASVTKALTECNE